MNGDVYRLREELLERIEDVSLDASMLEHCVQLALGLEKRIAALEANKCQCGNKATKSPLAGAVVGEIRSASVD